MSMIAGKSGKIAAFGELMLRLSPPERGLLRQAASFDACYGGSEANTLVLLSCLGERTEYVTALPDNPIGQAGLDSLRRYGVGTSRIIRGGDRMGIYFLEKGASMRPSEIIYDRTGSSVAAADAARYDWDDVMSDADWFHFTGITPALSPSSAAACRDACEAAKRAGASISCDINYRRKLWSAEEAAEVLRPLAAGLTLCLANEDAAEILGVSLPDGDRIERCRAASRGISETYGCRYVAMTVRNSESSDDNTLAGTLYDGLRKTFYVSRTHRIHIVDRIGGGDAFGGGLIYALRHDFDGKRAVEFAVAASVLKHSTEGDYPVLSLPQIEALADGGDGTVRVGR